MTVQQPANTSIPAAPPSLADAASQLGIRPVRLAQAIPGGQGGDSAGRATGCWYSRGDGRIRGRPAGPAASVAELVDAADLSEQDALVRVLQK